MIIPILLLILGLILLVRGADWLVDGASSAAKRLGIAPIVIGLTVVAFGTSAPEFVVNMVSVFGGNPEIAIGNIVGSNIANILLILGLAGVITPLAIQRNTTWKEIPLALLAVALVWVMAGDRLLGTASANALDRIDGIVLLSFFVVFLYYTYGISKVQGDAPDMKLFSTAKSWAMVGGGLALLVVGGKFAVDGAVDIATAFGVSQRVIALTIVAVGTSLPELLTSVVAARKKQADIAVGNVVGSNIFNVFAILGTSAVIKPLPFSPDNASDALVAVGATLLLFLWMFIGKKHLLERWQAVSFLVLYVGYVAWVIV